MRTFFFRPISVLFFCSLFLGNVMPANAASADSLLRMAISVTRSDDLNAYVSMVSSAKELMLKIAIEKSPEADSVAIRRSRHSVLESEAAFFMSNRNNWMQAFPGWKNIRVLSYKTVRLDSTDRLQGFEGIMILNYKTETVVEDTVTGLSYLVSGKMEVWKGSIYEMEIRDVHLLSAADQQIFTGTATISSKEVDMTHDDNSTKQYIKYRYSGTLGSEKIILTIRHEVNSNHVDNWYSPAAKPDKVLPLNPVYDRLSAERYRDDTGRSWLFTAPKDSDTKLRGYLIDDLTIVAFELDKE